jgi:hypothetical protein
MLHKRQFNPQTIALALCAVAVGLVARVAIRSNFATDEFTYAHAAWAIRHGAQPFRDFFLHHFPFTMQLGALVFVGIDEPSGIAALRWLMVPLWLATVVLVAKLNRNHSLWAALLSTPVLASFFLWVQYGTQFRPDVAALAFFLLSVWLGTRESVRPRLAALLSGVSFVLAVWSSQKVVIYGVAMPLAWVVSTVLSMRFPKHARIMRQPQHWLLGVVLGCLPIALYLTVTSNWQPLYHWCFEWGIVHETRYPTRDKLASLQETLVKNGHWVALGVLGFGLSARRVYRDRCVSLTAQREALLLICAALAAGSYFMQNAPYGWSLVAPITWTALYAACALSEMLSLVDARVSSRPVRLFITAAVLAATCVQLPYWVPRRPSRREQDAVLANIAVMTDATDPVYDNTGRAVARPHVHFYFFTDKAARIVLKDEIASEMPRAIMERGATVSVDDARDNSLAPTLRKFLAQHFVAVATAPHVRLWGQTYPRLSNHGSTRFEAVRTDDYYVTPEEALHAGALLIDGKATRSDVVKLNKGSHTLVWKGREPAPKLSIVWLPRDKARRTVED